MRDGTLRILNCIVTEPGGFTCAPCKYLEAYARTNSTIDSQVTFGYKDFVGLSGPEPIREWARQSSYDIFCFSCISSSLCYGLFVAEQLKVYSPDALCIFGGPAFGGSRCNAEILNSYPQVDVIVRGEGERTFQEILLCLLDECSLHRLIGVKGIDLRIGDRLYHSPDRELIHDLDEIPFPYTADDLSTRDTLLYVAKRGCRTRCHYCAWDYNNNSRPGIRMHSVARIKSDLLKFFTANVRNVTVCDSTFTNTREELVEMLRFIAEHNRNTSLYLPVAQQHYDDEIVELMVKGNIRTDIYVQSFNAQTCISSGRPPFSVEQFDRITRLFKRHGFSRFDVELILGLPGDTYDMFRSTVLNVLEMLVRNRVKYGSINIDRLSVVPNSYYYAHKEEFGIHALDAPSYYVTDCNTFSGHDIQKALNLRAAVTLSFNHPLERGRFIVEAIKAGSVGTVLTVFLSWLEEIGLDLTKVKHHQYVVPEIFCFPADRDDAQTELAKDRYTRFFEYLSASGKRA